MDEQEILRRAAQHDAQVIAASGGGRVIAEPQQFLDMLDEAAARQKQLETDSRTVEQVADDMGQLYQRFLDAWWYGTADQTRQAANAFARAMEHPAAGRLYAHAAAIQIGDYVRVVGYNPDGVRDAATGVVEDVAYTERVVDPYRFGEPDTHYGFAFTVLPVVRADQRFAARAVDIWVLESGSPDVLRLPTPVDRGRQPWLDAEQPVQAAASHPAKLARAFDTPAGSSPQHTVDGGAAAPANARRAGHRAPPGRHGPHGPRR